MYATVQSMQKANEQIGGDWFSHSDYRGSSVASTEVINGRFYIEQCFLIPGDKTSQMVYRVVECAENGSIDYLDPSETFDTVNQACDSIRI